MAQRVRLPSISFIVARSHPGNVIGYKNKLPWRLKSDLKRFRRITTGHAIIMGRSTFESIGGALPDRTNIVMTRRAKRLNNDGHNYGNETQLCWACSPEDALFVADIISICRGKDALFVIGGEKIYPLFDHFVDRVYITEVFGQFAGDAFFKKSFPPEQWKILEEEVHGKNDEGDEFASKFSIRYKIEGRSRCESVSKLIDKLDEFGQLKVEANKHREAVNRYIQRNVEI
jgi:dihydrofolate reductase